MGFSKAHFRRVSPPVDTAVDIQDRRFRTQALEQAQAAVKRLYPVLTAQNAAEAIAYQERRYEQTYAMLKGTK